MEEFVRFALGLLDASYDPKGFVLTPDDRRRLIEGLERVVVLGPMSETLLAYQCALSRINKAQGERWNAAYTRWIADQNRRQFVENRDQPRWRQEAMTIAEAAQAGFGSLADDQLLQMVDPTVAMEVADQLWAHDPATKQIVLPPYWLTLRQRLFPGWESTGDMLRRSIEEWRRRREDQSE
ncbi:MAG: hypothetical protein G01um101425_217 [Candidatus Peregrinibacteria bacterium Gr01-1014_25]|nr:MAG: hypothetical protein G01um101425_217 [Candidatus Peregrinibacteria bacterium Gr01-1014_25]